MNKNKEKISFICFLVASICFYAVAIMDIFNEEKGNPVTNLCLGSAFLCLSTTHLNQDKKDK